MRATILPAEPMLQKGVFLTAIARRVAESVKYL